MRVMCAWCGTSLGQVDTPQGEADSRVSHGICPQCKIFLESNSDERSFQIFLDSIDAPVLLLDSDARVQGANRTFRALHHTTIENLEGTLYGDASECARARLPGGCGRTEHCTTCTVRRAVLETYTTGKDIIDATAEQLVEKGDGNTTIRFRVSTRKVNNTVLLKIEEKAAA